MFLKQSLENEKLEWKSAHGPIRYADFINNPELIVKDNYIAMGCIVVITNNGKFGTLTHLDTEVDVKQFINCLDKVLDKNKIDSEVMLVGGNKKIESSNFLKILKKLLENDKYQVTNTITGGSNLIKRHATLTRDKVIVETTGIGVTNKTEVPFCINNICKLKN